MLFCVVISASLVLEKIAGWLGAGVMMVPVMYLPSVERKNMSWPAFKGGRSLLPCFLSYCSFCRAFLSIRKFTMFSMSVGVESVQASDLFCCVIFLRQKAFCGPIRFDLKWKRSVLMYCFVVLPLARPSFMCLSMKPLD